MPSLNPPSSWAKTRRARIAHLYVVCENCGGKGWLIDGPGGLFGLAVDPEPCSKCGGNEGDDYDSWPCGGRGYNVACGRISYSSEPVVEAPEAERCRRCIETLAQGSEYPNLTRALASGFEFEPVGPRVPRPDWEEVDRPMEPDR